MATLAAPLPLRHDAPTIGVVSIAHGLSHFCQLTVPPLFPWIGASFALSNTQLGLLMSVFFVVSGIGQALAGFAGHRCAIEIPLVHRQTIRSANGIRITGFVTAGRYEAQIRQRMDGR